MPVATGPADLLLGSLVIKVSLNRLTGCGLDVVECLADPATHRFEKCGGLTELLLSLRQGIHQCTRKPPLGLDQEADHHNELLLR